MQRTELVQYCTELLNVAQFKDYAPNGLQIEGCNEIKKIVTGVTACQQLIDVAIAQKADAILVHHGFFWKNEPKVIVGIKKKRIASLLKHDLNLIGFHLPLDAHAELGNNAQLGKLWGLEDITPEVDSLVRLGCFQSPMPVNEFSQMIERTLNRKPLHLQGGPNQIQTVAWCSGGAQGYMQTAIDWQADAYISGEVSEQNTHQAQEDRIHYFAAGHHATERLGVKALGEHLADKFDVEVLFVDIDNPV